MIVRLDYVPLLVSEFVRDVELAWAAGIMDGEGSVTLGKHGRYRQPLMECATTDRALVDGLQALFGGRLYPRPMRGRMTRPNYFWILTGWVSVVPALRALVPYMRCPQKLARARFILDRPPPVTRNGYYTPAEREQRLSFEREFFNITGA